MFVYLSKNPKQSARFPKPKYSLPICCTKNIHHSQQFSVLGQISNFYIFLKSNLELNYELNPCAAPSHLLQMYKT